MDALRAADSAASPLRRSFQVSSRPRRLPFSVSFSPSGESVTMKGLPSTSISRFSCLLSYVALASPHVQSRLPRRVSANRRRPSRQAGPRCESLGLFLQPLGLECLDDVRPGADAVHVALHLRPAAEVDLDVARPAEHGEEVSIRDRVLCAHQKFLRAECALQVLEARLDVLARVLLRALGSEAVRAQERSEEHTSELQSRLH